VSQALIAALQNPTLFPHPVESFRVVETHISWVLLTGPFAYKIKKPVNFGFLDFTSLAARKHFCTEELRLNQRLTEGLYLEVIPITGSATAPQINGRGEVIEYALKMRQFPAGQMLAEVQARGELRNEYIDDLAEQIGSFHLQAPRVPGEHQLGSPEAVMAPVRQNFEQARAMLEDPADLKQLDALQNWAESTYARLLPLLAKRKAEGFIRECHGDIHLGNATLIDGKVVLFDCIEFNEPFRLIDIACDAAFLAMDLEDRGLAAMSRRYINLWLEHTGDYESLHLLNFYKAYRAMVRAKVCLFSLAHQHDSTQRAATLQQYRSYASLAESYSRIPAPFLAITHGVSAVGKSHVAMQLVEQLGAVRLRSDIERKRLFGAQIAGHGTVVGAGIYNADAGQATYAQLHRLASTALRAGYPVVIDATYLQRTQREAAHQAAEENAVPFLILDCSAPDTVIAEWLARRQQQGRDPSDATLEVIKSQQSSREPLGSEELEYRITVETSNSSSLESLLRRLQVALGAR
jgi:aminoglycoside phosphotransferase family enzyme/predicted kinase